jgi:RimJ/RimL family protein N-acetyltransferase
MDNISFKKINDQDIPLLVSWFAQPHVSQWWPTPSEDELIEKFLERIRSKNTFGYLVRLNDKPIGYIQYYYIDRANQKTGLWLPELPQGTVGIDQFIGDAAYVGKGYGTQLIKKFIAYLKILEPQTTTIIVDPDPTNYAAIRCYEKVGFRKIGIYETPWGHSLIMGYDIR